MRRARLGGRLRATLVVWCACTTVMLRAGSPEDTARPLWLEPVVTPALAGPTRVPLPLAFEPVGPGAFAVTARDYRARIEAAGIDLLLPGAATPASAWRLTLVDAAPSATARPSTPSGYVHDLRATSALAGAAYPQPRPLHQAIVFDEVYPGIDVRYRGTGGHLEQDFLVAPGADPARIRLRPGGGSVRHRADGALEVTLAPERSVILEAPRAWQVDDRGRQRDVAVSFRLDASDTLGFALGPFDPARALVIDPVVTYSGAMGGSGNDEATAVALDGQGRIHLAGYTTSNDFAGTSVAGAGGAGDVFVARLDPSGQSIEMLARFGGSGEDHARALAVDAQGRLHVAGLTYSRDFPLVRPVAGLSTAPGGANGFVATVSPAGNALTLSTYLGGSDDDEAHGLALAPDGGVVVVGDTRSADFEVGGLQRPQCQGLDGFLAKFAAGGSLAWVACHGGQASDSLFAIAIDPAGRIAVGGTTNSSDFPAQQSSQARAGGFDATVALFSGAGTLVTSTVLGGSGTDAAHAVAFDAAGAIHVAGTTMSPDFPATGRLGPTAAQDAFVASYTTSGARTAVLRVGGSGMDRARALATTGTDVYLVGQTASADFPVARPAQANGGGNRDAFVMQLRGGAPLYSTYLGTSATDDPLAVAVDAIGRVVVAGSVQAVGAAGRGPSDAAVHRLSSGDEGADTDDDALPDSWETQFNLSPDASDAADDPDGDGLTNLQEYQQGTHPLGRHTRYLAEGATIAPFETTLALFNPGSSPAAVLVRFLCQRACGVPDIPGQDTIVRRLVTLAPYARGTIEVGTVPGLADEEFATIVEADQPVVVDRTMTWDASGYGSHTETAMEAPAATWYLAEGATISGFRLFYLLQNPNPVPAQVSIEYLLGRGAAPVLVTYTLPPHSRTTLDVSAQHPTLRAAEVSARIETSPDTPILVERAMYLNAGRRLFGAGHASAGIAIAAPSWSFAEGATGAYFDTFLLIANPSSDPLTVRATYLLPTGTSIQRTYDIAAKSRFNIWVDQAAPELASTAVSTLLESVDDRPFVAERAMWWPGPSAAEWRESHNSPGALATSAAWGLADGMLGGPSAMDTYVLVANTSPFDGAARVTLSFEDDRSRTSRDYAIPARSRANVSIRDDFPQAMGRRFATLVESQGEIPAQLVVERALYADANRERWAAGSNALGTPLVADRVITITRQGVTPRILVVAPGEQITVRNADTVPHQIFSGPYLERSACPALNQIGYLAPGETRLSGNLTVSGVCPFLDDVRPGQQLNRDFQGFVIVK